MKNHEIAHLTNRESLPDRTVAAGEVLKNVQICPVGDWVGAKGNQHCSPEALQRVVDFWQEDGSQEILVDFEHNAEAGGTSDTSAAAWVTNLRFDNARGLVGDFKMTDLGAEAVSNRRLRFLSVAWYVNKETREPMKITSIALTNKPNIPVDPVLNREPGPGVVNVEEKKGSTMDMEKLKKALGLPDDATEDQILAAIKEGVDAKSQAAELQANAERAAAEKEAEEFAEQNKDKLDKAVLKAQFLANKEVAKALVAAIPAPKAPAAQQVLNKGNAQEPEASDLVKELNKLPAGEKRCRFVMEHAKELAELSAK